MEKETTPVERFNSLRDTLPAETDWQHIVDEIRGTAHVESTRIYRDTCARLDAAITDPATPKETADRLKQRKHALKAAQPAFVCATRLQGGRTAAHVTAYTGLVMVDIDGLTDEQFATALHAVRTDAHTLLAHTTLSGRGIRVVARVEPLPARDTFAAAWQAVNDYYARLTGVRIDTQCKNATRMSVICHDPDALYRPDATPLAYTAPRPGQEKRTGRPVSTKSAAPVVRRLVEDEGIRYVAGSHNAYVCRCLYWMNRFGVSRTDALEWALTAFADYEAAEHSVEATVRSCYALTAEHATCHLSRYRKRTQETAARTPRTTVEQMERFIASWGMLRRNMLTSQTEVRLLPADTDGSGGQPSAGAGRKDWQPLDDTLENSLWCSMQRAGLNADLNAMRTLIQSDFTPDFHPLRHYLDHLPAWDGTTDHIGRLFAMVHCRDTPPAEFDFYARRWLVGMLASALNDNVVNHVILVLLGPQGSFKSSFMENLLPPQLRCYYTTKTNSQRFSKDDLFTLTENLIVNFEEIDSMQRSELNQLKAMTTTLYVKERPAYGRNKVRRPHVASLCATGNNLQFLTDDTGNRRWLPFEVESIDNPWTTPIPHDAIYAQAYALLQGKFRYWFSDAEIIVLNRRNRTFEAPNSAREMILAYFRRPNKLERPHYITSSQIVARFGGQIRLNPVQVGRAMKELGFRQERTSYGRFWAVMERTADEIAHTLPRLPEDNPAGHTADENPELPF
ncbi:MAG: hypothetical protein NC388_09440 [Clostridium sp.]|nr:hypothetical protein [Clostridium sp.]